VMENLENLEELGRPKHSLYNSSNAASYMSSDNRDEN